MLEDNASLTYLPYLTGCQQTLITYSNQASWAALARPIVENTLDGVWSLRVGGCGTAAVDPLLLPNALVVETLPGNIFVFFSVLCMFTEKSPILILI